MAVTRVYRTTPREGEVTFDRNNLLYAVLNRRYHIEFIVVTDTVKDGSNVVMLAAGVPKIGDQYVFGNDSDTVAICVSVYPRATANRKVWRVTAIYDTNAIIAAITDNPLNQPAEISWTEYKAEKPMVRDYYGVPVVTSSKNPFDTPAMQEYQRRVLTIVRNEATFTSATQRTYSGRLNKATFCGQDKFQCRMNSLTGARRLVNGVLHYQVTYEIEFRDAPDTFFLYVLDADWRDADANLFRDKRDYSPLANVTPLNGRGRSLFEQEGRLAATCNIGDGTITVSSSTPAKFPPAYKAVNADGVNPGPDWYFEIRIDNEVMQVTNGAGTNTWTVTRGYAGTTAAAHSNDSKIYLEPYFRRFIPPPGFADFDALSLPVV